MINGMLAYDTRKTPARAVVVSILLHGGLLLPFIVWQLQPDARASTQKLLVELYGMLADRQTEQRAPAAVTASPPVPIRKALPRPEQRQQHKFDEIAGPVVSPQPLTVGGPARPDELTVGAAATSGAVTDQGASGALQAQQTLNDAARDLDQLKHYLRRIRRKLQTNLIYPADAEKNGHEGTPVVGFTITASGGIGAGSLSIVESSGYDDLDASALQAARASEPFEKPPRVMDVKVGVTFEMR